MLVSAPNSSLPIPESTVSEAAEVRREDLKVDIEDSGYSSSSFSVPESIVSNVTALRSLAVERLGWAAGGEPVEEEGGEREEERAVPKPPAPSVEAEAWPTPPLPHRPLGGTGSIAEGETTHTVSRSPIHHPHPVSTPTQCTHSTK